MSSTSSTYSPPKTSSEMAAPASGKATLPALDEASVAPASGTAQSKEKTAPVGRIVIVNEGKDPSNGYLRGQVNWCQDQGHAYRAPAGCRKRNVSFTL